VESTALRDELISFSDLAWTRLHERLVGMSDDEYLWEPVAGCWTIRADAAGVWQLDGAWPPPEPAPVSTIAWRIAHLTTDDRFRTWLGLDEAPDTADVEVPPDAATAIEMVRTLGRRRHDDLAELTDAALWSPIGEVGGPFARAARVAWVLHSVDEVVHHGAEAALLRDLYRHVPDLPQV
jgi:hypothetical protein